MHVGQIHTNFNTLQMQTRGTTYSQRDAPPSVRAVQVLATKSNGMARSTAGTPHLSPRRLRITSSRMLVGGYLRMKLRRWMLITQMIRNMTTDLAGV